MTVADQSVDRQMSVEAELSSINPHRLDEQFQALEDKVRLDLAAHADIDGLIVRRRIDCRYVGQPEAMTVELPDGPLDLSAVRDAFEAAHRRQWNFVKENQPVMCVNVRVHAEARTGWRGSIRSDGGSTDIAATAPRRRLYLRGNEVDVPVFRRARLKAGDRLKGPAVIEEPSSCLVMEAGHVAYLDAHSNLIVEL
jgi:N-methylhydantoinase A